MANAGTAQGKKTLAKGDTYKICKKLITPAFCAMAAREVETHTQFL